MNGTCHSLHLEANRDLDSNTTAYAELNKIIHMCVGSESLEAEAMDPLMQKYYYK